MFNDVKELGARLKKLDEIVGTVTKSEVAIYHSTENMWAMNDAQGFSNKDRKYYETLFSFYKPLWKRGINTDIIGESDDFGKYKVIIAPMLYLIGDDLEEKLIDFVKGGGTLISTYMTGYVNENDLCHLGGFPKGKLKDLFGIWNEEIDTLYPDDRNTVVTTGGKEFEAVDYCEIIHPRGAKILAKFKTDFYKDFPAVTMNTSGKGKAYYIAFRDTGDFSEKIIADILKEKNISGEISSDLPRGVTAHSRTDGENIFLFVENYDHAEAVVYTDKEWTDIESGALIKEKIKIDPLYTLILKRKVRKP